MSKASRNFEQCQHKDISANGTVASLVCPRVSAGRPITAESPFFGKTSADLERMQAEVLIVLKGFDETFGQTVHARYSYRYDEIAWGAKFALAFEVDDRGELQIEVDKVSAIEPAELPSGRQ